MFGAVRVYFLLQLCGAIVTPDFPATVDIANGAGMVVIIPLKASIDLGTISPLMNTAAGWQIFVPREIETVTASKLPMSKHMVFIAITLNAALSVLSADQVIAVVVGVAALSPQ